MPQFTIQALRNAQRQAQGPADYLNKPDRNEWSLFDWLSALNAKLDPDRVPGPVRRHTRRAKEKLTRLAQAFSRADREQLSDEAFMAEYGRDLKDLTGTLSLLRQQSVDPRIFGQEITSLLQEGMPDHPVTDPDEAILAAENAVRTAAFAPAANEYAQDLEGQLADLPDTEENRARRRGLQAQIFVTRYLAANAAGLIEAGYPNIFNPANVLPVTRYLIQQPEFRSFVTGTGPEPSPARIGELLDNAPGPALPPQNIPERLGIWRDVLKNIEATGTGTTWYGAARDHNSAEYEAIRTELRRQIMRMEAGFPISRHHDDQMLQMLDAYMNRENGSLRHTRGSSYGKIRQNNFLRLYSALTRHPAPGEVDPAHTAQAVEAAFNNARRVRPGAADAVRLTAPAYTHVADGTARTLYEAALQQYHQAADFVRGSIPNVSPDAQAMLTDTVLRCLALQQIITKDKAGIYATPDEAAILRETAALRENGAVTGALAAAFTDSHHLTEVTNALGQADVAALHTAYQADHRTFENTSLAQMRVIAQPTLARRLADARTELGQLVQPGAILLPEQQERARQLAYTIAALTRINANPAASYATHVSDGQLAEAITDVRQTTQIDAALTTALADPQITEDLTAVLGRTMSNAELAGEFAHFAPGSADRLIEAERARLREWPETPVFTPEQKQAAIDSLLRLAALQELRRNRQHVLPLNHFPHENYFSQAEIGAAVQHLRHNGAFMQALEAQVTGTASLQQTAESLASSRFDDIRVQLAGQMRAFETAMAATGDNEEQKAFLRSQYHPVFKRQFARLRALHELQMQAGSQSAPVTDEQVETRTDQILLRDDTLAQNRLIDQDPLAVGRLYDGVYAKRGAGFDQAYQRFFHNTLSHVPYEEPAMGSVGQVYQNYAMLVASADGSTVDGRAIIKGAVINMLALRRQIIENGPYAMLDPYRQQADLDDIEFDPLYNTLFDRVATDNQVAVEAMNTLQTASGMHTLKADADRAGAGFTDPLQDDLRALAPYKARELVPANINRLAQASDEWQPGQPLTDEQKIFLRDRAADILVGYAATAELGPEERLGPEQLQERRSALTTGQTEEGQLLLDAVERAARSGENAHQLMQVLAAADAAERRQILRAFARPLPAALAQDARQTLMVIAAADPEAPVTDAQREAAMEAYARLHVMSMAAADPAQANVPLTQAQADQRAAVYLQENRERLLPFFAQPSAYTRQTLTGRWHAAAEDDTLAPADRLARQMALVNLTRRAFPDALVTDEELAAEEAAVRQTPDFALITADLAREDRRIPLEGLDTSSAEAFRQDLETRLFASAPHCERVLQGADAASPAGLLRLAADRLRHGEVTGNRESFRRDLAEAFTAALLNDGAHQTVTEEEFARLTRQVQTLPEFENACRTLEASPTLRTALIEALPGMTAAQLTERLNGLAKDERQRVNAQDTRVPNLLYDIRYVQVASLQDALTQAGARTAWTNDEERQLRRSQLIQMTARNQLLMANPDRAFFTEAEITAAVQEIEANTAFLTEVDRHLAGPLDLREMVYNFPAVMQWSEMDKLYDYRALMDMGFEGAYPSALDTMAVTIACKLTGEAETPTLLDNRELNLRRNDVLFSEEYLAVGNAIRTDPAEYDRMLDILKLPPQQFRTAYKALTDEYKVKYPTSPHRAANTMLSRYTDAMARIKAAGENPNLSNDDEALRKLADDMTEVITIRRIVTHTEMHPIKMHRDLEVTDNPNSNAFERRHRQQLPLAEAMLGGGLDVRLRDENTRRQMIGLFVSADDLYTLQMKEYKAEGIFTDPLEQNLREAGLTAPPELSRAEIIADKVRETIMLPGATREERRLQLARLYNLSLHTKDPGTGFPDDATLEAEAQRIAELPEFALAADGLEFHPDLKDKLFTQLQMGMGPDAFGRRLNGLAVLGQMDAPRMRFAELRAQFIADMQAGRLTDPVEITRRQNEMAQARQQKPAVNPHINILYALQAKSIMPQIDAAVDAGQYGNERVWKKEQREKLIHDMLQVSARNYLLQTHPDRLHFTEEELTAAYRRFANDQKFMDQLKEQTSVNSTYWRKFIFDYAGCQHWKRQVEARDHFNLALRVPNLKDRARLMLTAVQALSLGIYDKVNGRAENNQYVPGKENMELGDRFLADPKCQAAARAIAARPALLDYICNRLLPLDGKKLQTAWAEFQDDCLKKFPAPGVEVPQDVPDPAAASVEKELEEGADIRSVIDRPSTVSDDEESLSDDGSVYEFDAQPKAPEETLRQGTPLDIRTEEKPPLDFGEGDKGGLNPYNAEPKPAPEPKPQPEGQELYGTLHARIGQQLGKPGTREAFAHLYAHALIKADPKWPKDKEPTLADVTARAKRLSNNALTQHFLDKAAKDPVFAKQMLDGPFKTPDAAAQTAAMQSLIPSQYERMRHQLRWDIDHNRPANIAKYAKSLAALARLGADKPHTQEELNAELAKNVPDPNLDKWLARVLKKENDGTVTVDRGYGLVMSEGIFKHPETATINQRLAVVTNPNTHIHPSEEYVAKYAPAVKKEEAPPEMNPTGPKKGTEVNGPQP